jgi:UDP-N-acetylmuramate--alanine ligase
MIAATRATGLDPSFVIGGELSDLRTNAHLGDDDLLVLEADEAFSTFQRLHLRGLMVTNVEADHLDHYETLDRLEDAFADVVRRVDGPVVIGVDDPGGRRLAERTSRPRYGTSAGVDWRISDVEEAGSSVSFTLRGPGVDESVVVGRPGLHVARNAGGVLALLGELGHDVEAAAAGLKNFAGVKRRLEVRARVNGVTIIDSYAHHPTEVAADIRAVAAGGWQRIWVVFQPHLYSRTEALAAEFGGSFTGADHVVVTDVYGSREAPVPGVTGELVADAAMARSGADVHYVPHLADVAEYVVERVKKGDLVLTLGAGDVTIIPDLIAPRLATKS